MKTLKVVLVATFFLAMLTSTVYAGIWESDVRKDDFTDVREVTVGYMLNDRQSVMFFCAGKNKDGIAFTTGELIVGGSTDLTYRFDKNPPVTISALTTKYIVVLRKDEGRAFAHKMAKHTTLALKAATYTGYVTAVVDLTGFTKTVESVCPDYFDQK